MKILIACEESQTVCKEVWAAQCGGDGVKLVGIDLAEIIDAKYSRWAQRIKEEKKHE